MKATARILSFSSSYQLSSVHMIGATRITAPQIPVAGTDDSLYVSDVLGSIVLTKVSRFEFRPSRHPSGLLQNTCNFFHLQVNVNFSNEAGVRGSV